MARITWILSDKPAYLFEKLLPRNDSIHKERTSLWDIANIAENQPVF